MGSTDGAQPSGFSVFYVILGGAALLTTVIFPITVMFALRHYRRGSLPTRQRHPGALGVMDGGDMQQKEPKLFDVYVKQGLEVHEPRFEHILVSCWDSSHSDGSRVHAYLADGSAHVRTTRISSYQRFVNSSKRTAETLLITQP